MPCPMINIVILLSKIVAHRFYCADVTIIQDQCHSASTKFSDLKGLNGYLIAAVDC